MLSWERYLIKRDLGIARCGLACCLCSENSSCHGCNSGECPDKEWCENRKRSIAKCHDHCYNCGEDCRKGLLSKIKPYGFTLFVKRYGLKMLLDCLERNEENGILYHRDGIVGDYDEFDDIEKLTLTSCCLNKLKLSMAQTKNPCAIASLDKV